MNNAEIKYYQKDWVGYQRYLINQTLQAGFEHDLMCVGWATMRLALRATKPMYRHSDWYRELKKRVRKKDRFSLQELRRVLP